MILIQTVRIAPWEGIIAAVQPGDATVELLERLHDRGPRHIALLMRHSARTFEPGLHDLENQLTATGRDLALGLGRRLPRGALLRGYASPPARCMETAELVLEGHRQAGGKATRHRPLEALGVFYALDQMKMWQTLQAAGGLAPFVGAWVRGELPPDAVMPAPLAARLLQVVLADKLDRSLDEHQIDICVTHDMTLYLLREVLLQEPASGPEVGFLDALAFYRRDGALWVCSQHGEARRLPEP